jgi:hypothetical protein
MISTLRAIRLNLIVCLDPFVRKTDSQICRFGHSIRTGAARHYASRSHLYSFPGQPNMRQSVGCMRLGLAAFIAGVGALESGGVGTADVYC